MKVVWSDRALKDLAAVLDYLEAESVQAADDADERIREAIHLLNRFPGLGRMGRLKGTRELVIKGTPYLVAYRIESRSIRILRLVHGARLWPKTTTALDAS